MLLLVQKKINVKAQGCGHGLVKGGECVSPSLEWWEEPVKWLLVDQADLGAI